MIVAFDCDGTLIDFNDEPRREMVELCRALHSETNRVRVIIWSGGGKGYAEQVARKCGLRGIECFAKFDAKCPNVDIAFDDDTTVRGVRTLLLWKKGDLPALPPLGDCRSCELNSEEWKDHDFEACAPSSVFCKCGYVHRVYAATHTEEWGDGEFVPICDECED